MDEAQINRLKLDIVLARMRRKNRLGLMIISHILEICACGLGWYIYGWQMFVVLFLLLWATNIKVRLGATK